VNFLFTDRPSIMGILNVTPDSFSDGGQFQKLDAALGRATEMVAEGADIIDVGGESTRPGANAVTVAEELDRVIPVIEKIRAELDVPISLDSSTPEVISEAGRIGVELINDVRALQRPGALAAAAATDARVCLMHMQGQPATMQDAPSYDDLVADITTFFRARIAECEAAGIAHDRILLDPGFGFGKTPAHNLTLVNQLQHFAHLGCPLLVGLSRKSTIKSVLTDSNEALLIGSIVGAVWAFQRGASVLRVHDVRESKCALTLAQRLQEA
jgi:dihydropteroate synthase